MHKIPHKKLLELVGSLYEIAQLASTEAWIGVFKEIADLFDAEMGGLTVYDTDAGRFKTIIGRTDAELLAEYYEKYHDINPFGDTLRRLKAGEWFNREEHIPDDEFRRSDIYKEFFARAGIFHIEYHVFKVQAGLHGGISFIRPEGAANFSTAERDAIAFLIPHLERSFQLYLNLFEARLESRVMEHAFDRLAQGIIVIDQKGKIMFANREARTMIDARDGLEADAEERITASTTRDLKMLRSIIAKTFNGNSQNAGQVFQVSRPSGLRRFEMLISLITGAELGDPDFRSHAIMFITDPERESKTASDVLRQIYGLTRAEARIASMLTEGRSVNEVCEMLGIKQNTARTHLKHIFDKTDTGRQSELIKLILNSSANLSGSSG